MRLCVPLLLILFTIAVTVLPTSVAFFAATLASFPFFMLFYSSFYSLALACSMLSFILSRVIDIVLAAFLTLFRIMFKGFFGWSGRRAYSGFSRLKITDLNRLAGTGGSYACSTHQSAFRRYLLKYVWHARELRSARPSAGAMRSPSCLLGALGDMRWRIGS